MEFLKDLLAMLRAKNNESAGKLKCVAHCAFTCYVPHKYNRLTHLLRYLLSSCSLNETYTRDMQLAADIADDQHNIFAPKIQLFPLDMEPIIKTQPNAQKPSVELGTA
jgi:hypothetical protein